MAATLLAALAVHAEPAVTEPDMHAICAGVPEAPVEARALATRAHCILLRLVPSEHPYAEARELARRSLQQGDPVGGYLLYVAFLADPANRYVRDGKVDMAAYDRLKARPLAQRHEQVEAIDGLAFAATHGHVQAAGALAVYFHETVAPGNVDRLADLAGFLVRKSEASSRVQQLAREAERVQQLAPATKVSPAAFPEVLQVASDTAAAAAHARGKGCTASQLKSVRSGDISDAQYLPLTQPGVRDSYLVRGTWTEQWIFTACDREVPLRVRFAADGWGGASFAATLDKAS